MQPMSASAKMPVEAKPFPPGQECCCASWADVHLTSFRKGKASASYRKKKQGFMRVIGNIYHLPDHRTPTLISQRKADLRHPTFELIYYEAQFAILLQWLCQRPIEPWMRRSVSSNPNRHLRIVSCHVVEVFAGYHLLSLSPATKAQDSAVWQGGS